jgi:hypothetical protein
MTPEAGTVAGAVVEKLRAGYWLFTNPAFWLLVFFAFWHAGRYDKEMTEKDLEEWREKISNPPK